LKRRKIAVTALAQVENCELTTGTAAKMLGVPGHTVLWWINHRGLPASRRSPRGAFVIEMDDLRAWVAQEKPCFIEWVEDDDGEAAAVSEAEYARRLAAVRAMYERWGEPYPAAVQA